MAESNLELTGVIDPPEFNTTYYYNSENNGKPVWKNLDESITLYYDDSGFWNIESNNTPKYFYSVTTGDNSPLDVAEWNEGVGASGIPVFTIVPGGSEPTFGLPADVVALITSRFGTVANFLRLRNQGQI